MRRFALLPAEAVLDANLSKLELRVLAALALHANKRHQCWPSQATLSEMLGSPRQSICRALAALEDAGHLTATRRDRTDGGEGSKMYALANTPPVTRALHPPVTKTDTQCHTGVAPPASQLCVTPIIRTSKKEHLSNDQFESFWVAYPRHVGKKAALTAWRAAIKEVDPERLLAAATAYARQCRGKDQQYVAHARTWLHQGRWEDEGLAPTVVDLRDPSEVAAQRRVRAEQARAAGLPHLADRLEDG